MAATKKSKARTAAKKTAAKKKAVAKKAAAKKATAKKVTAKKTAVKKNAATARAAKDGATNRKTTKKSAAKSGAKKKQQATGSEKKRVAATKATKTATKATKKEALDFAGFPAGSVTRRAVTLCLSCVFRLFTQQLGLAPRTAYTEIRRYSPSVAELSAKEPQRPFFKASGERNPRCPYCDAAKRWHAQVTVHRIEGGAQTDAARRALVKRLPARDERFQVSDEAHTAREVFFDWLDRLGHTLDFEDDRAWMMDAARAYLERHDAKTDWAEVFDGLTHVRRSQRLEEGWAREGSRLYLSPPLYNDVLLVQYLVSRSHRHGGRTFEGRLTLPEFVRRLRHGGHLAAHGITESDRFDVLERLVEQLAGGDAKMKLHYIIDRSEILDRAKDVYARYAS